MSKVGHIFSANNGGRQWLRTLRISAGVLLVARTLSEWGSHTLLYSSHGFIPSDIAVFSQLPFIPSLQGLYGYIQPYLRESLFLQAYFGMTLIAAMMLVAGYYTRIAAIMSWALTVITLNSSHLTSYGFDAILTMMLFYCVIFAVGSAGISETEDNLSHVYLKTLQFHVCIIYFVNAVSKITGPAWHDGSGLWDMVHQPQFTSWITPFMVRLLSVPHVAAPAGMLVIILELLFPFLIWIRPVQRQILSAIILLHLIIAAVMGLWLFALAMILLDISAFGVIFRPD
ncbi:MAG: hypothetical protein JST90_19240 [Bacteroidetes bacterium]|nr:hypothetical protein [Bacteroidota bacterium]